MSDKGLTQQFDLPPSASRPRPKVRRTQRVFTTHHKQSTLRTGDCVLVGVASIVTQAVWMAHVEHAQIEEIVKRAAATGAVAVWVFGVATCVAESYLPRITSSLRLTFHSLLRVWLVSMAAGALAMIVFPAFRVDVGPAMASSLVAFPAVMLWRVALSRLFSPPDGKIATLVVGSHGFADDVQALLEQNAPSTYRLVGYFGEESGGDGQQNGIPRLDQEADLTEVVATHDVAEIIVEAQADACNGGRSELVACMARGVRLVSLSALNEELCQKVPVQQVDSQWLLDMAEHCTGDGRMYEGAKRLVDIVGALVGLAITGAALPFVAIAIYLDDPGPIFYSQRRVGRHHRHFNVYKFRSMVTTAEQPGEAQWASDNDSRVTRVGKVLRQTRLDEFPQFWNVLKGEMSLVGPRPERPEFTTELERVIPFYDLRHAVKPGVTGWAQVKYRYGNSVEDARRKLEYDLYYIRHRGLCLDLAIIVRTIGVVLGRKGT